MKKIRTHEALKKAAEVHLKELLEVIRAAVENEVADADEEELRAGLWDGEDAVRSLVNEAAEEVLKY